MYIQIDIHICFWNLYLHKSLSQQARLGGAVVKRYACDSEPDPEGKFGHGKARLHAKLRKAGYSLALSPAKAVTRAQVRCT